jgi:acyl-CoA synthetase (AMP-forming)/AMP-acid ligase II
MQATPTTWRMLVDSGWQGLARLRIACGGEGVPADLVTKLCDRAESVWHMYGPTETTVWSSIAQLRPSDAAPTLGGPIANTRFAVVDGEGRLLPTGISGELVIGGDGVARGYHDRPALTAERFVDDPTAPGSRAYRTGDLVRRRNDGMLEFLGRLDHQVKLRGFRIELGEIEAALCRHPAIGQAIVVRREDEPGDPRLAAYLVTEDEPPSAAELRRHLLASLPQYMVPAQFVRLEGLPLTSNGKVDRNALPAPDGATTRKRPAFVPPRTPVEELVAEAWRDLLGAPRIGAFDDFFELGGNSLLLARVNSRLAHTVGLRLPLRRLFELPVLADLAAELAGRLAEANNDDGDLARLLEELEEVRA